MQMKRFHEKRINEKQKILMSLKWENNQLGSYYVILI